MNARTSKLIFPAILFLFACLIAFGENGPTPQVVVGSSGISDGSVTNNKLAEPVSVANGGTGATTAAAGLAALGGASLNGSSTVDFAARDITATTVDVGGGSAATPSVQLAPGYGFYQVGPTTVAYSHAGSARFIFDADGVYMNSGVFRVVAKTPASATATGIAGTVCWDSSYIYICTAANTWKRVAISTW